MAKTRKRKERTKGQLRAQARRAREKFFNEASPADKRRIIARDVIAMLDAQAIVANTSYYLGDWTRGQWDPKKKVYKDARKFLEETVEAGASCTACALGAMVCADVLRRDGGANLNHHQFQAGLRPRLKDYFDPVQLSLIESAFEGKMFWDGLFLANLDDVIKRGFETSVYSTLHPALKFAERWAKSQDRLRAIMVNIEAHGGEFIPSCPHPRPQEVSDDADQR